MRRLCLLMLLPGCFPTFIEDYPRVDAPRVLAVRSLPAEARPGDPVLLQALVASADGSLDVEPSWSWCTQPRAADERTAVSAACLAGEALAPTPAQTAVLPNACTQFGPIPPPQDGDSAPRRAMDPDPTGGYHAPVLAGVEGVGTFGFVRVRCDLAGARREVFDAFEDRYLANEHPQIVAFDVPNEVEPGEQVELSVEVADGVAEAFVRYDPELSALIDETEALTAHWYVTGGEFSRGQSDITDGEARILWTAPQAGGAYVWVVVRDSRGGMGWAEARFDGDR